MFRTPINSGRRALTRATLYLAVTMTAIAQPAVAITTTPRVLVVKNDTGGMVGARVREIQALKAAGSRVQLKGKYCLSACTMYLGMQKVCVSPSTRFGFHGPSFYGRPLAPQEFERWSRVMANHYPKELRSWFLREARYELNGYKNLKGSDLIRMGVPRC